MTTAILIWIMLHCHKEINYTPYRTYKTDTIEQMMHKCEVEWNACVDERGFNYCKEAQQEKH